MPKKKFSAQYPGLFLFTNAARMMRPVINLATQKIEYIGTFEQIYMEICVIPEEAYEGVNMYTYIIFLRALSFKIFALFFKISYNVTILFLLVDNSSRGKPNHNLQ